MINIKAYTEDLEIDIVFHYEVEEHEVDRLVEDLKKENLTVEVSK